jgi:2-polyprenyl-3-methyl-5-hydroxy-6-metoxy-1,4-benzoquinol methylase
MVEAVLREYPGLGSIADVGCGQGIYAAEFQNRGIRVVGCEYAESGRRASRRRGVEVYPFDLSQPQDALPGVPYDAAVTIEVGEHIPQHLAHSFVAYLTSTSNLVIFTAAAPGQGGHGHINEQPKSYWVAMFRSAGFDWDARATDRVGETLRSLDAFHILYDNLLILRRTN